MTNPHKGSKATITQAELMTWVGYFPETGDFIWLKRGRGARQRVGDKAGWVSAYASGKGRIKIAINGQEYMAHRLAWLYMTGRWPEEEVDHINGDGTDNRWLNLRAASSSENLRNRGPQKNNTSGYKGVCFDKRLGKFLSGIKVHGKRKHLGVFETAEEAYAAYCGAATVIHGKFAKTK